MLTLKNMYLKPDCVCVPPSIFSPKEYMCVCVCVHMYTFFFN